MAVRERLRYDPYTISTEPDDYVATDLFAFHGYVELWIDGRPLKATPAFNAELCARFGVPALEFDGERDALLQPFDGQGRRYMEYLRDRGLYLDLPLDEILQTFAALYRTRTPAGQHDEAFHGPVRPAD